MRRAPRFGALEVTLALLAALTLVGCGGSGTPGIGVYDVQPPAGTAAPTHTPGTFKPPTLQPPTRQAAGGPAAKASVQPLASPAATRGAAANHWREYPRPDDGFTLFLPPAWQEVNAQAQGLSAMVRSLGRISPALLATFLASSGDEVQTDLRFVATDGSSRNLPASLSVVYRPGADASLSAEAFREARTAALEAFGRVTHVEETTVELPAGRALRGRYALSIQFPGIPPLDISIIQYAITHGDRFALLVFSTDPSREEADALVFEQIVGSFRWLP